MLALTTEREAPVVKTSVFVKCELHWEGECEQNSHKVYTVHKAVQLMGGWHLHYNVGGSLSHERKVVRKLGLTPATSAAAAFIL